MSATAADRTATTPPVDEVRPTLRRHVLRVGPASFLVRPRVVVVGVVTTVVALVLFALSVGTGDYPLGPLDVGRILLGGGTRVENVVVFDVALPRALISVLVGVGFGASGALTQTIARNPLATPDVLGITAGASTATCSLTKPPNA
ncbi:MAG: iron chelate uptake ABC transporter family permease subunit, partial [Burkholderiaceae bacterium]|nr:iron chelate uptake ABC transporter family permease subunit [Burkholderiaceae bacterium]